MKFIDFFAGIGGFREGLEREGHQCVGWCEFDKFKQEAYRTVHDTEGEWFSADITDVQPRELPKADLFVGGFPCQSFSIAGNRGGFEDTRGTLFFEIARLVKERQPKYLLLENVRGLLSHDEGKTFGTIIKTLWEFGYDLQWQVLNSKNFGVPQNRERIFIVGHLRGKPRPKVFPFRRKNKETIRQFGNIVDDSDINFKNPQRGRVYETKGICPTLNCMQGGGLEPKFLVNKRYGELDIRTDDTATCLDANYHKGIDNHGARTGVIENKQIRKLTPLETFRLQGFPDEWYYKCKKQGISDTQMYRAAGDSVTVNVVQAIAKRLP